MASTQLALLSQFSRPFFHPIPTLYVHKIVPQVGRGLPSCMSEQHVCARQEAKKGQTSDPLRLELLILLRHPVGAGNQTQLSYNPLP